MKLDVHDAKILEILQRNARASLKEIAIQSGLTPPTVSARMSSLEKVGVIKGYHIEIPPSSLGQGLLCFIIRTKPADLCTASEALAKIPLVREVHMASGGRIIAVAVTRGSADQEELTNEIGRIPEIIEYDHYLIVETKKKDPWAIVAEGAEIALECFYCRKPITGIPYKIRLGGRDHYLCCPICEAEYKKKFARIAAGAKAKGRKGTPERNSGRER